MKTSVARGCPVLQMLLLQFGWTAIVHPCVSKIRLKAVAFLSGLAEMFSHSSWLIFEKYLLLTERLHFWTGNV